MVNHKFNRNLWAFYDKPFSLSLSLSFRSLELALAQISYGHSQPWKDFVHFPLCVGCYSYIYCLIVLYFRYIQICQCRALNQYAKIKFTYFLCYGDPAKAESKVIFGMLTQWSMAMNLYEANHQMLILEYLHQIDCHCYSNLDELNYVQHSELGKTLPISIAINAKITFAIICRLVSTVKSVYKQINLLFPNNWKSNNMIISFALSLIEDMSNGRWIKISVLLLFWLSSIILFISSISLKTA